VRRERTARVQHFARLNGARYDASGPDLSGRDRELAAQSRDRAWIWDYDAEAEAAARKLGAQAPVEI
jgi:salicylate hydroxylase